MATAAGIQLTVEQRDLAALALRLSAEVDGKKLRAALSRNLRKAVAPAVKEVQAGARSIGPGYTKPYGGDQTSLSEAIAKGIGVQTRLTGPRVGVKVRASKKGMPRGFKNAPQRMNRPSFSHRVFGRDVWVSQIGNPQYFDAPLQRDRALYRAACLAAIDEMALRIARK